ncbi:MAG TPA: phosphate ABC transporter permease PstA [Methylomirabilota bacterium]|jgi:phosphate transport system permease protein|nr:phosphate ABC transporter permease PstA [Methylomirabilota bacterium]
MRKLWRSGEPFIWLTGGALALALLLVAGLIGLILYNGLGFFWPKDVLRLTLRDGKVMTGQLADREPVPGKLGQYRIKLQVANRDLYGADFQWIDESQIVKRQHPADAAVIERTEWGTLIGTIKEVRRGDRVVASGPEAGWAEVAKRLPDARRVRGELRGIEKGDIGRINHAQEQIRLKLRGLELRGVTSGPEVVALQRELATLQDRYRAQEARLTGLRTRQTEVMVVAADDAKEKALPLAQVVDVYFPNAMRTGAKVAHYAAKAWAFVADDPREANTEGGVFPAIFGTVMMVMIMSVLVTPLGVLAAFYLREYARQGPFVSAVRIAVNNLAGVPSIVFGVFGVGFFIYLVGGSIDRLFYPEALPTPTFGTGGILWASLTLALLTVPVVIVATEEGLAAVPGGTREASLALSATKLETTLRVVLPAVLPSILTGLILAMARAAGEVAPLMITGVVKFAPALPVDGFWPFVHLDRKFMHLGFHIYDVGFQSPNVDAARPMVFATTLLLLTIVVLLNLFAIGMRNRLRRKYATAAV